MCNRDSFILLPVETGIPIAWSLSYHHEVIHHHLRTGYSKELFYAESLGHRGYIQIECTDGNIHKWDWDNTPTKLVVATSEDHIECSMQTYAVDNCNAKTFATYAQLDCRATTEPDIPHWLEANLSAYQDKTEQILEKLNPIRDRQHRLLANLMHYTGPSTQLSFRLRGMPDLEAVIAVVLPDSSEVREFDAIVNACRGIDGFVHTKHDVISMPYKSVFGGIAYAYIDPATPVRHRNRCGVTVIGTNIS